MRVEFLEQFSKDIDTIKDVRIKNSVAEKILELEEAVDLSEIRNIKKLKGFKTSYRIRVGDYRIGLFFDKKTIELARVLHRKEIYRFFP
jgi:mRNA interferase RelE/StbE